MTRSPAETAHLLTLDLYDQVLALREENAQLRALLERATSETEVSQTHSP